jgi:hypothetical protein
MRFPHYEPSRSYFAADTGLLKVRESTFTAISNQYSHLAFTLMEGQIVGVSERVLRKLYGPQGEDNGLSELPYEYWSSNSERESQ